MKAVKLLAKTRTDKGTSAARRLRHQGWFPAVIYGEGKAACDLQLNEHDFKLALKGHTSEHLIMDLDVEGEKMHKVLLKDVQHHPVSGRVLHADFHEISMTKKLRVELPIRLIGEPVGVTQMGGVMEHILRQIEVECLPSDIVEHVDIDVSALKIGDSVTIANVPMDTAKYTVLSDKHLAVATVKAPRAEEEAKPADEAAAAGPEVITEKKAEEGEAGAEEAGKKGAGKDDAKKAGGKEEAKDDAKKAKEKK